MKDKIIIDFLVPMNGRGGAEVVINQTACYLQQNGYRVRIIQGVYNNEPWLDSGLEFYPLMCNHKMEDLSEIGTRYLDLLRENGTFPDIIVATPWPVLSMIAKMIAGAFPETCKVVSWLHGPIEEYAKNDLGGMECLRYADAHLVLNGRTRRKIMNDNPEAIVKQIENPIDFTNLIYAVHTYTSRTLVYVGRLSEEKHVETMIEALAKTKDVWMLDIIGDGDERARLKQLIVDLHLENRVNILGWKEKPWENTKEYSAMLLSSEYEGYSIVTREALACGLPVISTPVDGIIDIITPGVNGYLYAKGDSDGLAYILDCMADHTLPQIKSYDCRKSAESSEAGMALAHFMKELVAVIDQ